METVNYKNQDKEAIIAFLKKNDEDVEVAELIEYSGAEKLRVYSILFELTLEGVLSVTRKSVYGAPEAVKLI